MINTYFMVILIVLLVVFINKRMFPKDVQESELGVETPLHKNNNVSVDRPITTTISQKLSEIMDYVPKKVNEIIDNKPITIIRNKGNYEPKKPIDGT